VLSIFFCHFFYLHTKKNFSAEALQSVLQLMGEKELYEFWLQSYKVLHFSWDQEKAALVLKMWQKKFNEVSIYN